MSEPLLADAYPATVEQSVGTATITSAAKGPTVKSASASPSMRKQPAATSVTKGSKVKSTRAQARAQARAARPDKRSAAKGVAGVAAVAAQVDPLSPELPAQRHLEIVGQRSRLRMARQRRARLLLGAAGAAAVFVAFALVYLHVIAAQRQFTLDDLNTQVTQQEATYQRLRLQVAQLNSPARIVSVAETKLGMVQPSSVTYLTPSGSNPSPAPAPASASSHAPAGDSDWPQVKALTAGTP